jgi:hypothetical protein
MNTTRTLLAALALTGPAAAAQAQEIAVMSQGESFFVQYNPVYRGNIVGGGEITSYVSGKDGYAVYGSANHVASYGVASFSGASEGDLIYTPSGTAMMLATR